MEEIILEQINEKLQNMEDVYPKLRKQKTVLDAFSEYIKSGFETYVKNIESESTDDVKSVNFNGVIIRYVKKNTYKYNNEFKKELQDLGMLHLVTTPSNDMDKRFDLSEFMYEDEEGSHWLHNATRRTEADKISEAQAVEQAEIKWREMPFEELVAFYTRMKNAIENFEKINFEPHKQKLINLMVENNVAKAGKFTVKEPKMKLDFNALAQQKEMLETVLIATDGKRVVDLINFEYRNDIDPYGLIDGEVVKKNFGAAKVEKLISMLGQDYYYMQGQRLEKDILMRFDISHSKVEELVDAGYILVNEVFGRELIDSNISIEIIDELSDTKRKEMYFNANGERRVQNSLRMEAELRERDEIMNSLQEKNKE